jgi:hypothetical protein
MLLKIVMGVGLIGMALSGGCSGCCPDYSDGERTGTILKFSRKGVMYKSWEGRLDLGGMSRDSEGTMVRNFWDFSVTNEQVVPKIQEALRENKRVTLHYTQWAVQPMTIDSSYVVDGVK